MRIDPDMPRCSRIVSPRSSGSSANFPRRCNPPTCRPESRDSSLSGRGQRRSGRPTCADRMRRPSITGTSARLTVSTSGNSGMGGVPAAAIGTAPLTYNHVTFPGLCCIKGGPACIAVLCCIRSGCDTGTIAQSYSAEIIDSVRDD